ncbi:MAG: trypsin-like peptidase domain-containing protein [Candidatus Lambdaproteobacteria bacterium]|nr:trypsin-like peptidase domain-containing protein [Candidatus Lambdaproteobacteria bacterium]
MHRIPTVLLCAALLALSAVQALPAAEEESQIEAAVVSIDVTAQRGDWYSPWQRAGILQFTGSGFLVGPGQVMTNAHVVSDAKQILVRRNGNSRPYFARVEFIAHDSDLALLRVSDPSFDAGVAPLRLGDLPSLLTRVRTYGFPAGGEKISRTEGVVSRIQFVTYVHSSADAHLAVQTDSAINPGNSGGPVIQDGLVVGVAFQVSAELNDVGYFIPTTVVQRFLDDIRDGSYDGYAEMAIRSSNLNNEAYRAFLRLPAERGGVVVDAVLPASSADGLVLPGDVILAIGVHTVGNDGNILYHGHTLPFEQIAEEKQVGDVLRLTLWRDGGELRREIPLRGLPDAERVRSRFDVLPDYIVYAGLVFMELDRAYMETFGNFWEQAPDDLLYEQFFRRDEHPQDPPRRAVVLSRILPHAVNRNYRDSANSLVSRINGVPISGLTSIPAALARPQGGEQIFELGDVGNLLILNAAQADAAHAEILRQYGVAQDRRLP